MVLTATHERSKLKQSSRMIGMPPSCALEPERVVMQPFWFIIAALSGFLFGTVAAGDGEEVKFSDCPAAVKKTLQAEARGAKLDTVSKERDEDAGVVYRAYVTVGGKRYAVSVLEDGTLAEMTLAVEQEKVPLDRCPDAVRATFQSEAFGEKINVVDTDVKYGVTIYQTVVDHMGRSYEIAVAEDGTLVEKVLVIDDEDIKLSDCPAAVRTALHEQAKGGEVGDVTRSTGIGPHTFEAEVKIRNKVYLIEVAESGFLIAKSLEAFKD